jgi:UDP-N-acetylmuramate--alanine ligase
MELTKIKYIYFLGIGGIGMSALARYFLAMGKQVAGYDKTATNLTAELAGEGMDIHFEDDIEKIPAPFKSTDKSAVLIVYTPAVPREHSEYAFFLNNGFEIKKRSEVLGLLAANSFTVGVAGTHGKTTTSSLIAHLLKTAQLDPSAFLGGITQNYNTNLLLSEKLKAPENIFGSSLLVVEADEYDRSFLTLFPQIAVITSMDADHLDIYGDEKQVLESYALFGKQVKNTLIIKNTIADKIYVDVKKVTYSVIDASATYFAQNVRISNGAYHYDIVTPTAVFTDVTLGLPGLHNVENSIAATAVAVEMGVSEDHIRQGLASFKGVRRRFDYHIKTENLVFIDDYAHHPAELKAAISSVKELYPHKKITGIFQPHLYSRTRDFADDFAESLDLLDECLLLEIYPAREAPITGVDSNLLLAKMKSAKKNVYSKKELITEIRNRDIEVLITMGAGDIDALVLPLKEELMKRINAPASISDQERLKQ